MTTVYSPEGKKIEMEGVDARECVEHLGYTYAPIMQGGEVVQNHKAGNIEGHPAAKRHRGRPVVGAKGKGHA